MWVWIVFAVFIYAMLGCFHAGFLDLKFDEDALVFLAMIILWPLFWVLLAVALIFMIPIRFGKKFGRKYLSSFGNYLDKLFGEE